MMGRLKVTQSPNENVVLTLPRNFFDQFVAPKKLLQNFSIL